ncbi:ribosome small subunit-dependent GTPase A [Candidatus Xianfuyuplasma coldseepsis]|uniref:Small ribosomal subunit biogenesis GTPase RsgA n=1 Tax=Candidatus Xianfuyuplasma coldseepsis TaxID=2782163 RepID=A0A7L7KRX7_9MOLU|nr:ribosome small subunit-dependent GTPase A [Xianfuyuplasma coldseepsis]QMS85580.1 ribosome small subunit-dependent GTPase A [Xianfuyuplasma coldseepsis]
MKQGRIIKLIGGLYTVRCELGINYEVKARGKFRHINESPKVGDIVTFDNDFIMTVEERENNLVRPPVANVDQALLINSTKEPNFSFHLLDRFLMLIENEDITPVIVVTKIDLLTQDELNQLKEQLAYYETYYKVVYLSSKTKENIEELKHLFEGKISVFAGQTGAGKSSLLNALNPHFDLETNEISKALGRGKHTTRHSELLDVFGGLVADTPGFSKLDFYDIELENVPVNFVDFFERSNQCKFRACTHINEPKCKVQEDVKNGNILPSRYENYKIIYDEIKNQKPKYRSE